MPFKTSQCLKLAVGVAVFVQGCEGQDADRLSRIGKKAAERVENAAGGTRGKVSDGWQAARGAWGAETIDSRVVVRLRWERCLAGSDIQVTTTGNGVVILRGVVNDATCRRRALELAEATDGVERVVDELGFGAGGR